MTKNRRNNSGKNQQQFVLRGKIEELGDNVYSFATRGEADRYTKVTENLAAYFGRKCGKKAQLLMEGIEKPPEEPKEPSKADGKDPNSVAVKRYEKELSHWLVKRDEFNEMKGMMFISVVGQCTLALVNKLESHPDWKQWKDEDDVVSLNNAIKNLSFSKTTVQYKPWNLTLQIKKFLKTQQRKDESLSSYYKRFQTIKDVVEEGWGPFVPTKMALENKLTAEEVSNMLLACIFIAGVDKKRYGVVAEELNN